MTRGTTNHMARRLLVVCLLTGLVYAGGCASPKGGSAEEKRAYVRQMRSAALADLYRERPYVENRIKQAPGYGVFSNIGGQFFFVGGGHGYGVVVDQASGHETFMRVANVGVGLGLGVTDFRAVFVFNDPQVMKDFIAYGWEFGAGAEATAKYKDNGGGVNADASFNGIDVYQVTESGASVSAMLDGTKYWVDNELN